MHSLKECKIAAVLLSACFEMRGIRSIGSVIADAGIVIAWQESTDSELECMFHTYLKAGIQLQNQVRVNQMIEKLRGCS